jgi:two-component system sensor histidine kinase KdpD
MVLVEISDDGPGISDEAKAKLFDMFYTADNVRGDGRRGLGLGLSLCKSMIIAHGGTIYLKDNVPHGTVFCFTLQAEEVNYYEQTLNPCSRG